MIEADELRALCQRIIQSGELGRSRTYAAILEYLAEQAITGSSPKEVSIAMDVLGRDSDFDVGKDSIVRVHIYHLRNKLNTYYAKYGKDEKYRLDIPKGQYMLTSTLNGPTDEAGTPQPAARQKRTMIAAGLAISLLIVNLVVDLWPGDDAAVPAAITAQPHATSPLWAPLLDDNLPVLVLVGDYYIMGELDETGRVRRMVREFDINSRTDLQLQQQAGAYTNYLNLDLNYTPTSIPMALARVMQVFGRDAGRIQVKLMSEFSTADLVGNHVIYLGYLSGLHSLEDLVFAASGLTPGLSYDEVVNLATDERYQSSSGLSTGGSGYRDYGLLTTFPSPGGAQYVFLAGMRDEGLVNLADIATDPGAMQELGGLVPAGSRDTALEALYEVRGFGRTNFEAGRVYGMALDTRVVWQNRLLGTAP